MKCILPNYQKGALLFILLVLLSFNATAQQFVNGVRQGVIKVRFTQGMTGTLSQMNVQARSSKLTTGIRSVDEAAVTTKAKNLYRLFPYDAKHEDKLRKHGLHLWYVVELDATTDPKTAISVFRQLPEVESAEVDYEKTLAPYMVKPYTPGAATSSTLPFNDPMLADQWHYKNTAGGADVNLYAAWQATAGNRNIIVSVHDQGVDVKHKDLAANMWVNTAELNGTPGVDDDGNGYIDDVHGWNFDKRKGAIDAEYHGTHVAGTIAAVNNNGIGVSGIAGGTGNNDGVRVMSLQILGGGNIENSFVYAANNGAVISQNSWGYSLSGAYEQSVLDAIDYFIEEAGDYEGSPMRGGIVIFAAGNSDYDAEWYPGYYSNTLSVAALAPTWQKASYSNYGAWVDIAAPGGEIALGSKNGVLSTVPQDKYAYMEGTSMACPHVSGIAALALANRDHQLTRAELWNKLVTGVVNIDAHNENYLGKLGSGAIDAALAIKNDMKIAPETITNLAVTGTAQEFATVQWSVPSDEDDGTPVTFQLYYHTAAITLANINQATKVVIKNTQAAGNVIEHEVQGLLGLTTYHFAVTSTDRWGNISALSNGVSATTNDGPAIAIDENSQNIAIDIDAAVATTGNHTLTLLNNASGILRWNHFMHHKNASASYNAAGIRYPVTGTKKSNNISLGRVQAHEKVPAKVNSIIPAAFEPVDKSYTGYATNIIGETDLSLTNSAAAKFYVTETDGFNLTDVRMYLKHNPELGPVVVEIYKGNVLHKNNRVYAQEYNNYNGDEATAYITLNEQLYFQQGEVFWVVFHVPAGNLYPLGIGFELEPAYSDYCYMSFDMGNSWMPLADALGSRDFAWSVTAVSYNQHLGTYLSLDPESGDVAGNSSAEVVLTANGAQLVNGAYQANVIIASNDASQRELRIPVTVNVLGHKPVIDHTDIADFNSVFIGTEKTFDITFSNVGYGNFNNPEFSVSGSQFEIKGSTPWQLKAREQVVVTIAYKPVSSGNANGVLTLTNGDQTYSVALFGVGAETSKIKITPETQTINNVAIGDVVNAQITVENTGAYPLKYFIPGFDSKGVSANWPSDYHTYGYKLRTNYGSEANPLAYEFQNIKSTGVNITQQIPKNGYYALDMGFQFPYYNETMSTVYIALGGFTTFDNSISSINSPSIPGNEWTPKGYISPLGTYLSYLTQGDVYYQTEADRIIIQYDNVTDGWSGTATVQMVLFANGDIRFYYDELSLPSMYLSVLIEDMAQQDGILINNWNHTIDMYSGLALGLDYPGPNIVTEVSNGSGTVLPGQSTVVDVTLNTASLAEGTVNRYVNFISNDPANSQQSALIQLEINAGGVAQAELLVEEIAFGDVFQGAVKKQVFTIKNPGTANLSITGMAFTNGAFILTGDRPTVIKPGLYKRYEVTIPTAVIASLNDELVITYAGGETDNITVTGNVVPAPAINIDLSVLAETLNHGETSTHPLIIENTGEADMEIAATGAEWLTFGVPVAPASTSVVPDFTYVVEKNNDGSKYQWIDIRKDGTQMPFIDWDDFQGTYWRELELPFAISFYGQEYTSVKIGDNGILSFEEEPLAMFFTENVPSASHPGPCIMPYWTFSGFTDYLYPIEDIGIFYKFYDDKIIITWSYFTNNFGGMGDPVSAQVIFYKNGTMKFQYKSEEGGVDATSLNSIIGLQRDSETGVVISAYSALDYGTGGLAYIVKPAQRYTVAPGSSLAAEIKLDARNVYGGVYNDVLIINTNVPNQETLVKPVELTVLGEAVPVLPESIAFGEKMLKFEWGMPAQNTIDFEIGNDGSAPFSITWIEMADVMQGLTLQLEQQSFWGKMWTNISEIYSPWAWELPIYTIKPGEKLKVRAVFAPETAGTFADEAVFTTSEGELRLPLTGTGVEPPVIEVNTAAINVVMNTVAEPELHTIAFNNTAGNSGLQYNVSIEYGRAATAASTETMATTVTDKLGSQKASVQSLSVRPYANYNRVIKHTDNETPDTFVGTGGTAPFTLATKFNSGQQSFNISHIETFFRKEALTSGTIEVTVRAGGTTIADSPVLASGSATFSGTGFDEQGNWFQVALNQPAAIFPNEDFYVVVTYPLGIEFPQGTLTNISTAANRYLYYNEGVWYDIQQVNGFTTAGWLMYAAEQTPAEGSWISVTSATEGVLIPGEASAVELKFDGAYASRGTQRAGIVISSNDLVNPIVKIPVSLHLNEAPMFSNVPDAIIVAEGAKRTVIIPVTDAEGHAFTVQPAASYAGVTHTLANGMLTIVLQPGYATAGNYTYKFTAIDEHEASRELVLYVEITHTNRAPAYTGTVLPEFIPSARLHEFSVREFFSDPDNDAITFTATSLNPNTAEVFVSTNTFLVKALHTGDTRIAFTVTDVYGAVVKDTLNVRVGVVLSAEQGVSNGVMIYPNPVSGNTLHLNFGNEWIGTVNVAITDATGRTVLSHTVVASADTPVNIASLESGVYFVHAEQRERKAVLKLMKE